MERMQKIRLAATAVICLVVGIIIGLALAQFGLTGFLAGLFAPGVPV